MSNFNNNMEFLMNYKMRSGPEQSGSGSGGNYGQEQSNPYSCFARPPSIPISDLSAMRRVKELG